MEGEEMIPHNKPSLGIEESQAIAEVIRGGWIAPGEKVKRFEQAFADYAGAKYAVAVNSGTAALRIALNILGSQDVVTSTYSCAAAFNAIGYDRRCELRDINLNDFNIAKFENLDYDDGDTIIVTHTFGVPAVIKTRNLRLPSIIEDCSQALGSYVNGQHVGLQGDIGIFSFGPSKMITTGSGGMLVTNNKDLACKAREFLDYANHVPAFNFAMNDLQAEMGIVQLNKLMHFLWARDCMAKEYKHICREKGWDYQRSNDDFDMSNNYRFVIIGNFADRLKQYLADNGITAIVPIEQRELLYNMLGLDTGIYPNAEWVSRNTLSLPIFPDLLENGFDHVIQILKGF
jgi:perosamine synthetase